MSQKIVRNYKCDFHLVSSANLIEQIYKEADALKKLSHKNIIKLHHTFMEGKDICMIMEYAGGGELLQRIEENGPMDEVVAHNLMMQLVNAISYCHTRGMVHRDLKMENVLFKDTVTNQIRVVDFGIAGVCDSKKKDKVDAGSLAYMPPEVLSGKAQETTPSIDVWAIGCMYYGMLYGCLPFWGDTEEEFVEKIIKSPVKFPKEPFVTK